MEGAVLTFWLILEAEVTGFRKLGDIESTCLARLLHDDDDLCYLGGLFLGERHARCEILESVWKQLSLGALARFPRSRLRLRVELLVDKASLTQLIINYFIIQAGLLKLVDDAQILIEH